VRHIAQSNLPDCKWFNESALASLNVTLKLQPFPVVILRNEEFADCFRIAETDPTEISTKKHKSLYNSTFLKDAKDYQFECLRIERNGIWTHDLHGGWGYALPQDIRNEIRNDMNRHKSWEQRQSVIVIFASGALVSCVFMKIVSLLTYRARLSLPGDCPDVL
jgi:hypothetical protein